MPVPDRKLAAPYEIAPLEGHPQVGPADVLDLWAAEGAISGEEAQERVGEVLLVGTVAATGQLAGVSTVRTGRSRRVGVDVHYFRTFVAAEHRKGNVAVHLLLRAYHHLEARYLSGEDTRAAGVLIEVQHEGLKQGQPHGVWPQTQFAFVGENRHGDHVRVRWFPGATVPLRGDPPSD
jgi:hypothetical protein